MKSLSLKLGSALFALALALPGHGAPADARASATKTAPKVRPKTAAKPLPQAAPAQRTPAKPVVRKPPASRPVTARTAVAASAAGAVGIAGAAGALAAKKPAQANAHIEDAEASLLSVYRLIGQGRNRQALALATALVHDHPNFQLAQLVYGDLLSSQVRPVRTLGDVHPDAARTGAEKLADLREESHLRLKALRERPPPGTLPSQFMALAPSSRHAIAIDISRSRLYLFENSATGLRLAADFYISIGKLGAEKNIEGDKRTPLGIYFITSNLDPKSLKEFYGSGALPINYPNPLDQSRGKTGSGIWLHGTPPEQFSRAPRASDGCVVLSNPDLEHLLRTVQVRTTPVVIAQKLQWQPPQTVANSSQVFAATLADWQKAKSSGNLESMLNFYAPDFRSQDKTLAQWTPVLRQEMDRLQGRPIALKDVSYLHWKDSADTMVVTFGEVIEGMRTGMVKRQYWVRQGIQWKIFFEGVIG